MQKSEYNVPSYLGDGGQFISINYAPDETKGIFHIDLVSSLLFDQRKDVVIFGEGNFTFSIALAAARNTERLKEASTKGVPLNDVWDGITVTYYAANVQFNFAAAKNKNLEEIKKLNAKMGCKSFFELNYKIVSAVASPNPANTIRYGVDATTTADLSLTTKDVVWFQCPWADSWDKIPGLIVGFLENMRKHQKTGQYLLIGIANEFPYVQSYKLQDLGIFLPVKIRGYHFFGGDTAAIGKLLHLGYRHEGLSDIHDKIFNHHVTLVFMKE